MIGLFTHYSISWHFKKVFVYFEKSYFLFVYDICTCAISYGALAKASHTALNSGRYKIRKNYFPFPCFAFSYVGE